MKPSCKRIKYLIKDEGKSAKEYLSYGFYTLAGDEAEHRAFLKKLFKKRGCK